MPQKFHENVKTIWSGFSSFLCAKKAGRGGSEFSEIIIRPFFFLVLPLPPPFRSWDPVSDSFFFFPFSSSFPARIWGETRGGGLFRNMNMAFSSAVSPLLFSSPQFFPLPFSLHFFPLENCMKSPFLFFLFSFPLKMRRTPQHHHHHCRNIKNRRRGGGD